MVYLNTDNCASGDILYASSSPGVGHKAIAATKSIPAPYYEDEGMAADSATYYDFLVDWCIHDFKK